MKYSRTDMRRRTKRIAQAALHSTVFPIVFLVILLGLTMTALSLVFSAVAVKTGVPSVQIWVYEWNAAELAAGILAKMFAVPLIFGVNEYCLSLIRRRRRRVADVFLWYGDRERLRRAGRYLLWAVLFFTAEYMLFSLPMYNTLQFLVDLNNYGAAQIEAGAAVADYSGFPFPFGALAVNTVLIVAYMCLFYRFYLVPLLMADFPDEKVLHAVRRSWRVTRRHTLETLVFVLSFAGWFFAVLLTAGFAFFYVFPYFYMAMLVYAEYLRADYHLRAGSDNEQMPIIGTPPPGTEVSVLVDTDEAPDETDSAE